jgi:hypothetical protein
VLVGMESNEDADVATLSGKTPLPINSYLKDQAIHNSFPVSVSPVLDPYTPFDVNLFQTRSFNAKVKLSQSVGGFWIQARSSETKLKSWAHSFTSSQSYTPASSGATSKFQSMTPSSP